MKILVFAKKMGKNIGENISKSLSDKYSQKILDHAKKCATDALKTASKKTIQKTADATGDLTGNKIADRITKVSKTSQENNSEIVKDGYDKETPKERYVSPERRQKIYWWSEINVIIQSWNIKK